MYEICFNPCFNGYYTSTSLKKTLNARLY